MKRAFKPWKPDPASLDRLRTINNVLAGFMEDDITVTLRQLYYQLVSRNIIKNSTREYKNLGRLLNRGRLAGMVDWDAIEDRARQAVVWRSYDSIQQCVTEAAENFTLPRWRDQREYVELWCEKDALTSVLEPICSALFVPLMINRGYSSSSAMYEARNRLRRKRDGEDGDARPVTILYLGDFDPSGEDMVRDIRDRLAEFEVEDFEVVKVALNPDQVERWKLPPNPAKMSDSRAADFVDTHGAMSYEVDAIPPKDLQKLVRQAIEDHMDLEAYYAVVEEEKLLTAKLQKAVEKIK
jgi:hypothetical protein